MMSNPFYSSTKNSGPSPMGSNDSRPLFSFPRMHIFSLNGNDPTLDAHSQAGAALELRPLVLDDGDKYLQLRYPSFDLELIVSDRTTVLRESVGSFIIPELNYRIQFPQEYVRNWDDPLPRDLDDQLGHDQSDGVRTWQELEDHFMIIIREYMGFMGNVHPITSKGDLSGYPQEKSGAATAAYTRQVGSGPASGSFPEYDLSTYSNGKEGRLVLIDEENGSEIGEISGYQVQTIGVQPGSKDPVEVVLPENGGAVTVRPADYLKDAMHPAYANSTIVSTAATASRLIVTTSAYIANAIQSGADAYTRRTKPNTTPMTFNPATHDRVRQVHSFSNSAAKISSQTIGQVSKHAQNIGARIAGKDHERPTRGEPSNPGLLNKSLIAFSTIADGIDYASKSLLGSGANAATAVVGHKYGEEARSVAHGLTGSFKNVGLVYVDASGVSRRAIVKGVAKGMVIGTVHGGGEVMIPVDSSQRIDGIPQGWGDGPLGGPHAGPPSLPGSGRNTPSVPGTEVGFGNSAPPTYGSVQGTAGASGSSQSGNLYFPPPPGSALGPHATGGSSYGNMRSVSPRPYDPSSYRSPSPAPPPEKGPANDGKYRY